MHTLGVLEQRARESIPFEIESAHPLLYTHHAPPRHSTTSMTRISTVSHSIGPKLRSIDASHNSALEKLLD
jgi:hypothetical protein